MDEFSEERQAAGGGRKPRKKDHLKKWGMFLLRWTIAVGGIVWVLSQISLRDRVTILDENDLPRKAALLHPVGEDAALPPEVQIIDPDTHEVRSIERGKLVNPPEKHKTVRWGTNNTLSKVRALHLSRDLKKVQRILVEDESSHRGIWVDPSQVSGGYRLDVPHPLVEEGLSHMVRRANRWLLLLAIVIFPITFIVTSYRWNKLLEALDVRLSQGTTFVLNMVGAFYNTFMPGSTGGDVLKAWYVSLHTSHRTRSVMSVIIDRIIGLLTLVIMGGLIAAVQYARIGTPEDPVARACRGVALMAVLMLGATAVGLAVFYIHPLRRAVGLDFILTRLPKQKQVQHAVHVMEVYRHRPWLVLWALLVTFPVHITVVLSAMFAGMAFDLHLAPAYYFVAVPVIVLVGAIPISVQGAGVMEYFAILLTERQGCTISEAFALTMSIRLVQILWNLTGGIFVLRGGYHAPTETEQVQMHADDADDVAAEREGAPGETVVVGRNGNGRVEGAAGV